MKVRNRNLPRKDGPAPLFSFSLFPSCSLFRLKCHRRNHSMMNWIIVWRKQKMIPIFLGGWQSWRKATSSNLTLFQVEKNESITKRGGESFFANKSVHSIRLDKFQAAENGKYATVDRCVTDSPSSLNSSNSKSKKSLSSVNTSESWEPWRQTCLDNCLFQLLTLLMRVWLMNVPFR